MRIIDEPQLDFNDVLIQPKRSTLNSRNEVDIFREFNWKGSGGNNNSFKAIPVMASNMGTVGTPNMARTLTTNGYMCALEKHYAADEINRLFAELVRKAIDEDKSPVEYTQRISLSVGVNDSLDTIREVAKNHAVTAVTIDIANGYLLKLIDKVKEVRQEFPDVFIIVGNVVTEDVTTDLILAGANCVKVGIGNGAVCTTRLKAGIGRPQLSTVMECADAAHQLHAFIMCDGGCVYPCDINKAFCAGADFVMTGAMFAGCDEAEGRIIELNGRKFKKYYGMSSRFAQELHFGKFNSYRSSEGREKLIPSTGPLVDILNDINGSIRSCCTYIGSHKLKHMPKHATFYKVNRQLNTVFASCEDFV